MYGKSSSFSVFKVLPTDVCSVVLTWFIPLGMSDIKISCVGFESNYLKVQNKCFSQIDVLICHKSFHEVLLDRRKKYIYHDSDSLMWN